MSMSRFVVAVMAALAPVLSYASLVTYDFTVQATSGSLAGQISSGYLTYDDSVVPVGGGLVSATGLLTDLSFVWGGVTYDETTANTGGFLFDAAGDLFNVVFGTNCSAGICTVFSNTVSWVIAGLPGNVGFISYSTGTGGLGTGTTQFSLRTAQVPEPGSLALLGLGLAGLAAIRRRK